MTGEDKHTNWQVKQGHTQWICAKYFEKLRGKKCSLNFPESIVNEFPIVNEKLSTVTC